MTGPAIAAIARHDAHGGLWLVIPAPTSKGQPRPIFAQLSIAQGIRGPVATYEGGDLLATIDENAVLKGATWVPVDSKGNPT